MKGSDKKGTTTRATLSSCPREHTDESFEHLILGLTWLPSYCNSVIKRVGLVNATEVEVSAQCS